MQSFKQHAPIADVAKEIADGRHQNLACASPLTLTTEQTSLGSRGGHAPSHCCDSPCAFCAVLLCSVQNKANQFAAVHLSGGRLRLQENAE